MKTAQQLDPKCREKGNKSGHQGKLGRTHTHTHTHTPEEAK